MAFDDIQSVFQICFRKEGADLNIELVLGMVSVIARFVLAVVDL